MGSLPLTDRIGRKKSIMYGLLGYGIANAFTAVASPGEWPVFFVARFVAGFFIIMVMVQPFAMLEEFLPTRSRGQGHNLPGLRVAGRHPACGRCRLLRAACVQLAGSHARIQRHGTGLHTAGVLPPGRDPPTTLSAQAGRARPRI
ncbi:MFS transporter [Thermogymnomonas acidicola]|uniref:MFS transporter n=1 Tax=Thermogymnomonas acidicola TaxID=399579 RepID=UPI0009461A4D|nr:MFS transporter [Thermogymnomonas acidicola]